MSLPDSIRQLAPLVIGILVGGVGAALFRDSLPGAEGSPEARVNKLEVELKQAQNRIAYFEDIDPRGRRKSLRTTRDAARQIAENFREGKPVTPNDIFRATQPLMRDLSPVLDIIRVKQQKLAAHSAAGEIARKYQLNESQKAKLDEWFEEKAEQDAKRYNELMVQEGTGLEDLMRAAMEDNMDDGLDDFMPTILSGDDLLDFQDERMAERADRLQQEADGKVERLHTIVDLSSDQRDEVFAIMARNSRDYHPDMKIEGAGGSVLDAVEGDSTQAMLEVLTPDQRTMWQGERERRRVESEKELAEIGLSLPPEWDALEMDNW